MKNSIKVIIALVCIALLALGGSYLASRFSGGPQDEDTAYDESIDTSQASEASDDEDDPITKDYDNGIYFEEEEEDAVITPKKAQESDFVGRWEATSGQSAYYYGNVELNIKENGTWTGNITEEPLTGKWVRKDAGIYLTSEIFNCTLEFTQEGSLIMLEDYEDSDEEPVVVVLTKKK